MDQGLQCPEQNVTRGDIWGVVVEFKLLILVCGNSFLVNFLLLLLSGEEDVVDVVLNEVGVPVFTKEMQ